MTASLFDAYPDALRILSDMKEWMAMGFYEARDLPWPRPFGLAFRRLYENMDICIPDDRVLVPPDPFPVTRLPDTSRGKWDISGPLCDFHYMAGLRVNEESAALKKQEFPEHEGFITALAADLKAYQTYFGDTTHSNPDYRRVVTEGFDAMERELDEQIVRCGESENPSPEEQNLLMALKDYAAGVRRFHDRTADAVRKAYEQSEGERRDELKIIAGSFENCFLKPATTFVQGLLAVHFTWLLDGCDNLGRLDQVLGPLFEEDVKTGRLDIGFARRLLDELFINMERLNGYNLQIGGYTPQGVDGYNPLSAELLLACRRNKFRRPNMAFRVTVHTPEAALLDALDVLKEGTGRPALYNDELYVDTLLELDLGLTREDACDFGFGGCTETMIPGMSNVGCTRAGNDYFGGQDINLAKALELTIHDGFDPVAKRQLGLHTGKLKDFIDFSSFLAALKRQIQFMTDVHIADLSRSLRKRFAQGDPKLYRTFFTRDCVKNRKSFEAGGARYNWSIVNYSGIANMIDSLAAIRKCLFEDRAITCDELLQALSADFDGYGAVQGKLLAVPKFGNDDPYVDETGNEVLSFAWTELYKHPHPRGGRYLPACIMFVDWAHYGSLVGALPDGRKAGTVLADSVGPVHGRDIHGPTAMLKSIARLPLSKAIGTPVLNIRLQKKFLSTDTGKKACAGLVRTFFRMGGMQLQFSVFSKDDLEMARKCPEKYGDMIVRVGGYSEYFTRLPHSMQEAILLRTEYGG